MKTYKVIKPFFKLSNRTNYFIGDTIDLTNMEAEAKKYEGLIEDIEVKEPKAKKLKEIKISDFPQQKLDKKAIIQLPNVK